jgi:hypothetical protein
MNKRFSGKITVFHGLRLAEEAVPTGYAAIVDAYDLPVPFPYRLCCVGTRYNLKEEDCWRHFSPRYAPQATLEGHLLFALKYEGVDLAVLKSLFSHVPESEIEHIIRKTPTGSYVRRLWFLYEWLMDERLDIPDLQAGNYVPVIDPKMQYGITGRNVRRHRVIDNLPGSRLFCPLVFKTDKLEHHIQMDLKQKAAEAIQGIPADVISRTASFLLLKDSKASYAIENETPPHKRIERWGRIIGQAGTHPLDQDELIRLQQIVIGDTRFVQPGLRTEGGFVGEHDRESGMPIPEHISARPEDLRDLVRGIIEHNSLCSGELDPVVIAASLAFGFVYIHPFSDGNGRLHRYLIHHVLAENGFNPPGLVFPVSAVVLERINEYHAVLQGYSSRLLPLIEWEQSRDHNVVVSNDTADYYRYFDATPHAEFLYSCVKRTIEHDLPEEALFLQCYDQFRREVEEIVEMPSITVNLLFRFLGQHDGLLSKRARDREFQQLTDDEVLRIEEIYHAVFG